MANPRIDWTEQRGDENNPEQTLSCHHMLLEMEKDSHTQPCYGKTALEAGFSHVCQQSCLGWNWPCAKPSKSYYYSGQFNHQLLFNFVALLCCKVYIRLQTNTGMQWIVATIKIEVPSMLKIKVPPMNENIKIESAPISKRSICVVVCSTRAHCAGVHTVCREGA